MDSTQSKFSKQPIVGAQNTNQSDAPDQDVQIFQKVDVGMLPPHSTLVFAEQKVDKNNSTHRLALGTITMGSEQHPLWVYPTSPGGRDCEVHFVSQGGKAVPREQHDQFTLVESFCYLPTNLPPTKNAKFSPLATLIVYYFIVAGMWPKKPPTGGHGYVTTPVLREACLKVGAGMETASRMRDHDNMGRQPSFSASTILHALPLRLKREHDDSDLAAPTTKRVAIATDKVQLLEAEVNTLQRGYADMIEKMRVVLSMGRLHSTWASDILEGKNIPPGAQWAAKMQHDEDKKVLDTMIREFEASYGKVPDR
jgi:hypothetical protein